MRVSKVYAVPDSEKQVLVTEDNVGGSEPPAKCVCDIDLFGYCVTVRCRCEACYSNVGAR